MSDPAAVLCGHGLAGRVRAWRRGPLVDSLTVRIPYRVFEVRVANAGRLERAWLAVDAVSGTLDPYRLEGPPEPGAPPEEDASPILPALVPPERLRGALLERLRRQVYQRGFFRLRDLRLEAEDTGSLLYLAYCVGLRRKGERLSVDVVAAARGAREGGKLRDLIATWLAAGAPGGAGGPAES